MPTSYSPQEEDWRQEECFCHLCQLYQEGGGHPQRLLLQQRPHPVVPANKTSQTTHQLSLQIIVSLQQFTLETK
jgi:hypothetical protein